MLTEEKLDGVGDRLGTFLEYPSDHLQKVMGSTISCFKYKFCFSISVKNLIA
jgi:hypothetical protein